jgi:hypothetical protein
MWLLEISIVLLATMIWSVFPGFASGLAARLSTGFSELARNRRLAIALTGLLALGGAAATSLEVGIPAPVFHDEFSYLLGAQTFAAGKLYGQPHPMPEYFETFHVLQRPVHASKYLPGQALALALGILLFGQPIVSVWILAGLASAAITWMLQAWIPTRWALLGGLAAAVNFGFFAAWSQSYWGGLLATLGGALFLGALRRMTVDPTTANGAVMGAGLGILILVRPFEGGLFVLLMSAATLRLRPSLVRPPRITALLKPLAIAAALALTVLCGLGYYNWRLMGDPLNMPYAAYEEQETFVPLFLFQRPLPPVADDVEVFAAFREWARQEHAYKRTLAGFVAAKLPELVFSWGAFGGFALLVAFVAGFLQCRRRWLWAAAMVLLAMGFVVLSETWTDARKFAPASGVIILLATHGLRVLHGPRAASTMRRALFRGVTIAIAARMLMGFGGTLGDSRRGQTAERPAVAKRLMAFPGPDLVVVRYSPGHLVHFEWVYNEPEIDQAEVVWARDLGESKTCQLIRYYPLREVWLLEADATPPRLEPYPTACGLLSGPPGDE